MATVDEVRRFGPLCPVCQEHVPWEEVSPAPYHWCPHCGVSVREARWPTWPAGVIAVAIAFPIARASAPGEWSFFFGLFLMLFLIKETLVIIIRRISPPRLVLGDERPRPVP